MRLHTVDEVAPSNLFQPLPGLASAAMLATAGMMLATPVQAHGKHHPPIHHHASHEHFVHGGQRHKAYSRGYRKGYRRAMRSIEPTVVRVYRPFIRPARPIVVAPHHSWLNVGVRFPL